ncbi:MAG: hypothetical protein HYX41_05075, partial [Bdellovibrio sp.]|nr:hypothetical protein [Bdellovibrio sp.]
KRSLSVQATQVEMSPDGDRIFYASASESQVLGGLGFRQQEKIAEWARNEPHRAVYYHPFVTGRNSVFFGVEGSQSRTEKTTGNPKVRKNQLLRMGFDGKSLDTIDLPSDEEAYFYAHRVLEGTKLRVIVAIDDGRVVELAD